jgi:1-acyl-sn-glycerol-3-phosphate acyltransferase
VNRLRRAFRLAFFYAFQLGFVRPMLKWYWGAHYRRRSSVPKGPCIVVANHNSHLDAPLLMTMFPIRRIAHVHPVAAADYFGKTAWRRTMVMIGMNAMGIERTAAAGKDVLQPTIEALEAGESLIFFPEGSRGTPGVIGSFKPGIGKMVKSVPGVLVVPVFLAGAERSLPRGESVPVPLGIDVIIGKPRSYSPLLDARAIAEIIRADVLALAPPPPSVPGPRPPPPVRVACCGIDREANHALFLTLAERLGAAGRTFGISDTVLESEGQGVRPSDGVPVTRSRLVPRALAWAFRTGGMYRGSKFAELVERARIDEALQDGRTARFVVGDGSPLVDLLAWGEADFYSGVFDEKGLQQLHLYVSGQRRIPFGQWARFVRKAPEVWLFNVFDLVQPPAPDVLVLITTDPAAALERIRSQGRALESWENEAFLSRLQEGYRQVASVLRKRRIEVVELAAADLDVDRAATEIEATCRRLATKGTEALAGGS